jgi:hypothetical protein
MKIILLVVLTEDSAADRTWCGNDEAGHFTHHGMIPDKPDTVIIKLSWKSQEVDQEEYVGTFELHLSALLKKRYIRTDKQGYV